MIVGEVIRHPQSMHWVGPFAILQALGALAVGLWYGGKSAHLVIEGTLTTGTVVSVDVASKGATSPLVEFTTRKGRRVRIEGIHSSNPPYRVGDRVELYYLPSDPDSASIASFGEMWILPTVMLPVGLVTGVLGVGLWVVGSRRKRGRDRARAGLHLPGVVVGSTPVRTAQSVQWEPIVEVRHPQTGEVIRGVADQQTLQPQPGAPAVMHVEPAPPHGYVVELLG